MRYEDLVAYPTDVLNRIFAFIGEPFDEKMLRYHETPEAVLSASLAWGWSNTALPVLPGNATKYCDNLTRGEIRIVESIVGSLLDEFGYRADSETSTADPPSTFRKYVYRLADLFWQLRVEYRSLRQDRNCWRRWRRPINLATFKIKTNLRQLAIGRSEFK